MTSAQRSAREQRLADLYRAQHELHTADDPLLVPRLLHPRALDSEVLLVGQGLAKDTQRLTGYPYLLPNGTLKRGGTRLDAFLRGFGYTILPHETSRRYAYHTDVAMRYPGRVGPGRGDRRPSSREIAAAGAALEPEVELVAPQVVIALGNVAAQALLPSFADIPVPKKRPIETLVRQVFPAVIAGRSVPILVVYHPAFAFSHEPESTLAFDWAAAAVREVLAGPKTAPGKAADGRAPTP